MPWISRKKFEDLQNRIKELISSVQQAQKHAFLIGIEREGRYNVFTFARDGEIFTIKTMGLISDNLPEWKENLLR